MRLAFGSACHGAGRAMSRHQALRNWNDQHVVDFTRPHIKVANELY
jgi:RNA-splicing ligase RtcB